MMFLRIVCLSLALLALVQPILVSLETDTGGDPAIHIRYSGVEGSTRRRMVGAARQELQAFRTETGRPADLADAAYAMERWLESQGYAQASVSFRMYDAQGEEVERVARFGEVWRVQFVVAKGPLLRVRGVSFPGAESYDQPYLASFFAFGPRGIFAPPQPVYRRSDVLAGIARVEQLYLQGGYHEVSVGPHRLQYPEADAAPEERQEGAVSVVVPIEEGRRFTLRTVTMRAPGLPDARRRELRGLLPEPEEPYHPRVVAEGAARLRDSLARTGYRARVDASTRVDRGKAQVDVSYDVDSGPRLVFARLEVRSQADEALVTSRRLVVSQFALEPGDVITASKLDTAVTRLYDLGIFSTVRVEVEPVEGETGTPDRQRSVVAVHVTERRNRYVELAVGWGSYSMLQGAASYTDLNLFGVAREWRVRVNGSIRGAAVSSGLTDRLFLAPRGSVSATGSYEYREEPAFIRSEAEAELRVSYRPSDVLQLSSSYDYTLSAAIEADGDLPAGPISTGSFGIEASLDTRDSVTTPTRGYQVTVGLVLASPVIGSQLSFLETRLGGAAHVPFGESAVLSGGLWYATKIPFAGQTGLPIQERLFAGGPNSVRAYPQDALGPVAESGRPQGGRTRWAGSLELRIRLYRMLQGAVFYDVGAVSEESLALLGAVGHGPGIGLRYRLPVGPARVDIAYSPGPQYAAPRPWAWHIAVGLSF